MRGTVRWPLRVCPSEPNSACHAFAEVVQRELFEKGGFKALLRAMRNFLWQPMVQSKAFNTLSGLAGQFRA